MEIKSPGLTRNVHFELEYLNFMYFFCDQRASTSERAGSILFFAYGKNRAFPLDCVFNPPRGLTIPYMGNITIFGVQNGTCCVLVFVLNLKGKLTTYIN